MSELTSALYRTNTSVLSACADLGIEFEELDLEDLERCTHCSIWYKSYELTPDLDDNNICRFCETHYGR